MFMEKSESEVLEQAYWRKTEQNTAKYSNYGMNLIVD